MLKFIMILLLILLLAINAIANRRYKDNSESTIGNYSDDEVETQVKGYKCNIEVVTYHGTSIWRLNHKTENYPWHAYIDCKDQNFDSLEEAKKAVDDFQNMLKQRLEERYKKYSSSTKHK